MNSISRYTLASLIALLSMGFFAGGVRAQDDAQRLYMRGAAAYGDGRFAEAAALFEQAFALRPDAPLLYNLGRARDQAGEGAAALEAYERFLAAAPDATERTEVEQAVARLRLQRAQQDELARTTAPPPPPREQAPRQARPARAPVAASVSLVPWIIAGTGVATLIAASVTGVLAQNDYDAARTAPEHLRATQLEQSANDLGLVATILFVAGGVVTGAGLAWGAIDLATLGSGDEERLVVRVMPGSVAVSGAF